VGVSWKSRGMEKTRRLRAIAQSGKAGSIN
jgi:hypothetical protein